MVLPKVVQGRRTKDKGQRIKGQRTKDENQRTKDEDEGELGWGELLITAYFGPTPCGKNSNGFSPFRENLPEMGAPWRGTSRASGGPMKNERLFALTRQAAFATIELVDCLPRTMAFHRIGGQLFDSGTSQAANYRAADRAQSTKALIAKLKIVEEGPLSLVLCPSPRSPRIPHPCRDAVHRHQERVARALVV